MQRQVQGPGCYLILEGGHTGYSLHLITFMLLVVIPLIHFLGMNEVLRLVFFTGGRTQFFLSLSVLKCLQEMRHCLSAFGCLTLRLAAAAAPTLV